MKGRSIICILLIALLGLLKFSVLKGYLSSYNQGRMEAHIYNECISYDELKTCERYKLLAPAVYNTSLCTIATKEGRVKKSVIGVSSNNYLEQVEAIQMKYGSYFRKGAVDRAKNVVVISDELANTLFGTENALMNVCKINNVYYQVVGVYKKYNTVLKNFSGDGYERIYMPLGSEANPDKHITELITLGSETTLIDLNEMKVNSRTSYINDQGDMLKKIYNAYFLPEIICALGILVILSIKAISGLEKIILFKYERNALAQIGGYIVGVGLAYLALSKMLYLPSGLFMQEHFNFSYYVTYIQGLFNNYNCCIKQFNSSFMCTSHYTKVIMTIIGLIQLIIVSYLWGFITYLKNVLIIEKGERRHA